MTRPAATWLVFTACMAVAMAAMGWTSAKVLQLEKSQHTAKQQAGIEENVRLALWRMDSALATMIAEENARPHYVYQTFYPVQQAYTRMYGSINFGDVLIPSPLLTYESPYIQLHFQIALDGKITSPQAPVGNMRDLAEAKYTTPDKTQAATELLERMNIKLQPALLAKALGEAIVFEPVAQDAKKGNSKAVIEYQQRAEQQISNTAMQKANDNTIAWSAQVKIDEQPIRPVWVDDDTPVLARRVVVGRISMIQGCVLNWPAVQDWLLGEIRDLFPNARLIRTTADPEQVAPRMLAAIPAIMVIDDNVAGVMADWSALRVSLLIAWVGVVMAAAAIAVLLRGAISLSERRGAFVSAVTHELRTPLTTFRMYTDMLSRGMVPDPAKRQQYLDTLRREADRLSHLVENVLAYARLERGSRGAAVESVLLGEMIDRILPRLQQRCTAADMVLHVNIDNDTRLQTVRANTAGVEQVLFNLVDNACKYAAGGGDCLVHLESQAGHTGVELMVRDHGPGMALDVLAKLFQPFSKSAESAAESAPGVGLGLALSQRYARDMGGRLTLDTHYPDGVCFILFLPADSRKK